MMRRVIENEKTGGTPGYLELFRGSDLRRTLIVCGVYAAQNLTGNLIANQAVYFFRQAGISVETAFVLGLVTSALQLGKPPQNHMALTARMSANAPLHQ